MITNLIHIKKKSQQFQLSQQSINADTEQKTEHKTQNKGNRTQNTK